MLDYLKKCVLGIVLFTWFGCVAFHPQPLSPRQKAWEFESRRLDSLLLKNFVEKNSHLEIPVWPPEVWDFRLLTLAAFYYHPDLDVARARWAVARAGVTTAGEIPNPSVLLGPEFAAHSQAGVTPWLFGVSFDIPIETAGKRGYRIALAGSLSNSARLDIATTAWRVRTRLREALLDLYMAEEMENLGRHDVAVRERMAKLLDKRFAYGDLSRPVLTQYRIALDQARVSLQQMREQVAQNRARVAEALGVPASALEGIHFSFGFLEKLYSDHPSSRMRQQALVNRTDILSSLLEYEAAQHTLQLEIAKQYPDVHLGPGYKYDQGENKWSIGFTIALPVFNQNQGPIEAAEALRKEAADRFVALQAQVLGQIDRASAGYAAALETLETADNLFNEQKKHEQLVRLQFNAGEVDRLAVLGAELEVSSVAISKAKAFYHAQQMLGQLEDSLQCPLMPEGELGFSHALETNR
jgi:cobalt-zinc-cadmium efflux system outer membrane protein